MSESSEDACSATLECQGRSGSAGFEGLDSRLKPGGGVLGLEEGHSNIEDGLIGGGDAAQGPGSQQGLVAA